MHKQKQNIRYYLYFLSVVLISFLFVSCRFEEGPSGTEGGLPGTEGGPPGTADSGSTGEVKSSFFWEVKKEGKISYILGTLHYGIPLNDLLCSEVILEKLYGSDFVFVERVRGDAVLFVEKIDQIQKGIAPKENEQLFSPELFLPNNSHFEQLSPASQGFILQKDLPKNLSYSGFSVGLELMCIKEVIVDISDITVSMDTEIQDLAQNQQIPVRALDEDSVVRDLGDDYTKEYVEWVIEKYPMWCDNESFNKEFSDYKNGYINPDVEVHRDTSMFRDRNEKWLVKFKSAYNQYDRIFLIAGNSHFISRDNFIDMLRLEGFSVERVSC